MRKPTLVQQVAETLDIPVQLASAEEPSCWWAVKVYQRKSFSRTTHHALGARVSQHYSHHEVKHTTIEYRFGQLQIQKATMLNQLRRLTGKPVEGRARTKSLDDVSFSAEQGEVVGIIDTNGIGQDHNAQAACQHSKPTSGTIKLKVAPYLSRDLQAGPQHVQWTR